MAPPKKPAGPPTGGQATLFSMWSKNKSAAKKEPKPSADDGGEAAKRDATKQPPPAVSASNGASSSSKSTPSASRLGNGVRTAGSSQRRADRRSSPAASSISSAPSSRAESPPKPQVAPNGQATHDSSQGNLSDAIEAALMDEDGDQVLPPRRASAKRSVNYFESNSEEEDDDDDDDDDSEDGQGSPASDFAPASRRKSKQGGGRGSAKRSRGSTAAAISKNSKRRRSGRAHGYEEDDFVVDDHDDEGAASGSDAAASGAMDTDEDDTRRPVGRQRSTQARGNGSAEAAPQRAAVSEPEAPPKRVNGASSLFTTQAERRAFEERTKRSKNEQAFDFLKDPKDKDGNRPGDAAYDPRTLHIPKSAWAHFTPFEKQFWEVKQTRFDTILFFQKGKFYELYEEDALIAHREFDLKLTDRVKMKMAGVPESSFEMFAAKFLALGYKVGRVDQMETAVAKGMRTGEKSRGGGSEIVRRELRHVLTGGTIVDGASLPDDMSNYCIAIKESVAVPIGGGGTESIDAVPTFGICILDAATAEFRLDHFVDDATRTKLETLLRSLRLKEILHEKLGLSSRTQRVLKTTVPASCVITALKPGVEFLDQHDALRKLNQLSNPDLAASATAGGRSSPRLSDIEPASADVLPEAVQRMMDKPEAMSALGAMFRYLEDLNLDRDLFSAANFDIYDPIRQNRCLILDAQSLRHLNVLSNEHGTEEGTLLHLLNRCSTPFGKRLFKVWLVAPLAQAAPIRQRQNAVEDLLLATSFEDDFEAFARKLPDIERLMPRISAGKSKPRDFVRVLQALSKFDATIDALRQASVDFRSDVVTALLDAVPRVGKSVEKLQAEFTAQDDGSFVPRDGVYEAYDEADEAVRTIEAELEEARVAAAKQVKLSVSQVHFKHVGTKEIYQLEVPAKTKVPSDWFRMSQTQSVKRYYSPIVKDLVQSFKEAGETRLAALKQFQEQLFADFAEEAPVFLRAVKGIAELDCLLSLAKASRAMGEPTCRPEVIDAPRAFLSFEDLRHPCMTSLGAADFIANDVSLGAPTAVEAEARSGADGDRTAVEEDTSDVIILTGGNMAGKSTTARTTAVGVILAQLGCRVPAVSARLAPVDRIASRMGAQDSLFQNASTFMVEMLEASRIIAECTPRSLVIMDELGRGTSTFDGHAIAFAVLHHLVGRTRCLAFFLTHYTSLAYEFDRYTRVRNMHMDVLVDDAAREVVFTYRLVPGVAESSYGTQVAALAGVPHEVCDRAAVVSKEFAQASREEQARKRTSRIPLASLSDIAYLFKVAQMPAPDVEDDAGVANGQAGKLDALLDQLRVIGTQARAVVEEGRGSKAMTTAAAAIMDVDADSSRGVRAIADHPAECAQPGLTPVTSSDAIMSSSSPMASPMGSQEGGGDGGSTGANWMSSPPTSPLVPADEAGGKSVGDGPPWSSPCPSAAATKATQYAKGDPPSPANAKVSQRPPRARVGGGEQLVLDLGQSMRATCSQCGMSYDRTHAADVAAHTRHHDACVLGVEWSGKALLATAKEVGRVALPAKVVSKLPGSKSRSSSASGGGAGPTSHAGAGADEVRLLQYALQPRAREAAVARKLDEVERSLEEALGASPLSQRAKLHGRARLLVGVRAARVVCAAIVGQTEPGTARRVVVAAADKADGEGQGAAKDGAPSLMRLDDGGEAIFVGDPLPESETPPLAVHRIHVLPALRRCGLGVAMLDAALDDAVYGVPAAQLQRSLGGRANTTAFSQPTEAGRHLAQAWIRRGDSSPSSAKPGADGLLVFVDA